MNIEEMNEFLLSLITFVHILVVLFIVIVPFTSINYLLLLYVIIVPFIVLHWVINDNTCALTVMEHSLRKKMYGEDVDKNDCITARLIEPVYDFNKDNASLSTFIYIVVGILWLIAVYKLVNKYQTGEISTYKELFKF